MKHRNLPGINIQWPWSQLLISGEKTVETRKYPLPDRLKNVELALIETPGPRGKKEAQIHSSRIIGTISFSHSFQYQTEKDWEKDKERHCVSPNDPLYSFRSDQQKWGWEVAQVTWFSHPVDAPEKKGHIYAKKCQVPLPSLVIPNQGHSSDRPSSLP